MNLPTLIPDPYRLLARVVIVALIGIALYATGHHRGAEAVRGEWAIEHAAQSEAAAEAQRLAREHEQAMIQHIQKAEHEAEQREKDLQAAADAAHAAAGSLRNDIAALRSRMSIVTAEACRQTASAALELLGTCADEYRAVAAAADGHASDAKTLSDAWPE